MANISTAAFPFDNADSAESQWTLLFRELVDSGVFGSPGDTGFQVVKGTGFNFTVKAGTAILAGFAAKLAADNASLSFAPPPGTAGQSRIDRVVLRLDTTANTITVEIVQGTAAATPVAPNLADNEPATGIWELPLAQTQIANGDAAIGTIVDQRPFAGGRQVGIWTTATRPTTRAAAPLRQAKLGFNISTGAFEYWDVATAQWKSTVPDTVNNATNWSGHPLIVNTATPTGTIPDGTIWLQPTS